MPNTSMSFRRPWMFTNVETPEVNKVWLAEYMAQHDLTMEVALEHLSHRMRAFIKEAKAVVDLVDGSDAELMAECTAFVAEYKPTKDFYSPIPLVPVIKE